MRKLQPYPPSALPPSVPPGQTRARPLSDIRELTESSLIDSAARKAANHRDRFNLQGSSPLSPHQPLSLRPTNFGSRRLRRSPVLSPYVESSEDRSSVYSIPISHVPPRSTSKTRSPSTSKVKAQSPSRSRRRRSSSVSRKPAVAPLGSQTLENISNRNKGDSPIQHLKNEGRLNDSTCIERMPSRTFVMPQSPMLKDLLDEPTRLHPRLKLQLVVSAPVFVGGSTVEGVVRIIVDEAERVRHRRTLTLERVTVDLIGVEEVSSARQHIFLSLANSLVDLRHPPPEAMVEPNSQFTQAERSWILLPCRTDLQFLLTLPLDCGPPPFQSKNACIRYQLTATITIKDAGRPLSVRCSQDTSILSVFDPLKALALLPSPLTVSDEAYIARSRDKERVIINAGLHRNVWISGGNLFADVRIINESRKTIRRIELALERVILQYKHAPASTQEASASQARIFDQQDRDIVGKTVIKRGVQGFTEILPKSNSCRTYEVPLPRGHVTIKCTKYFEVRFYLSISVCTTHRKLVAAQLPITLIHVNSLDIPTNSAAQVEAAIEERKEVRPSRSKLRSPSRTWQKSPVPSQRPSRSLQGRAFAAPRMQSLERARAREEDIRQLSRALAPSPRKFSSCQSNTLRKPSSTSSFKTPSSKRKGRFIGEGDFYEIFKRLGAGRTRSHGSLAASEPRWPLVEPFRSTSALGQRTQDSEKFTIALGTLGSRAKGFPEPRRRGRESEI